LPSTATSCWCRRRWACRRPSSGKLSRSRAKANYLAGLYAPKTGADVTQPAMSQSWSQSPAPRFRRPHLVAALARPRLSSSACWSVAGRRCPSLDGVAADMVLGDLSDEAALNAWSTGADASSTPPASSRRAGQPTSWPSTATARRFVGARSRGPFLLLSSLAAREPQLSPYAASKRAAEEVVAGRSGPWLTVRAPAVYGPGDRETLAYFQGGRPRSRAAAQGGRCRLSLIHVADLAEALALALDRRRRPSTYEIDDGQEGGYTLSATWPTRAAGRSDAEAVARPCRARSWRVARSNAIGLRWAVRADPHARQGERNFSPRLDVPRSAARPAWVPSALRSGDGFGDTILWYAQGYGSKSCEIRRNKLSFHKNRRFWHSSALSYPETGAAFAHRPSK
jgi:uncharacterized protein YbjT (DUF2867 family)